MARIAPPIDFVLVGLTLGIALVAPQLPTGADATTSQASALTITGPSQARNGQVAARSRLDRARILQGGDGIVRMELTLEADTVTGAIPRVPTDVLVVLDKSGSMAGDKIRHARDAAVALTDMLGPDDRFGLVTYDDGARFAIRPEAATGLARSHWIRTIGEIPARGSTNMSGGLDLALTELDRLQESGRAARVILISDGLPNRGDSTHDGLVRRGAAAAQREHVLTTVGVGEDFNEFLMSAIADAGTGNYYYLQNGNSLAEVFAQEFTTARATVASGLGIDVKLPPGVTLLEAGGYPVEAYRGGARFQVGALHSGQTRSMWLTFRVPADATGNRSVGDVSLSWSDDRGGQTLALGSAGEIECVQDEKKAMAGIDKDAWEKSVIEEQYNAMRQQVSRSVRDGKKDEAKQAISAYKATVSDANSYVGSAAVEDNLREVDFLDEEIDGAFAAPDAYDARNKLSKEQQSEAWTKRRAK